MKRFLLRLIINAIAIYAAIFVLNNAGGISLENDSWWAILVLAVILGILNAVLKPILVLAGCSVIILTLGLGILLINTLLFYVLGWAGSLVGVGFTIANFWWALLGAFIISLVSFFLSILVKDELKGRKKHHK